MNRPIVVGLALRDDDSAPLDLATALARLAGAPLVLVSAYPCDPRVVTITPEYLTAVAEDTRARLERVAATLGEDHEVSVLAVQGPPASELGATAARLDAVAVVVGSTHRGALGRVLVGDVAAELLHDPSCPIAVAPRGYRAPARGLTRLAVAFADTPEGRHALAGAVEIARASGGSVRSFSADPSARDASDVARELMPTDVPAGAGALAGPPVETLAAATTSMDLLICGTRGLGAVRSILGHSVSRGLAHAASCPVLAIPHTDAPGRQLLGDPATQTREVVA